jgi:hypothetical protein
MFIDLKTVILVMVEAVIMCCIEIKMVWHIKYNYLKMIQVVNMNNIPEPEAIIVEQEDDGDYEND